ncbi:MAG: hypothetical protein FJ112_00225 [Deltaproteobacteria bacterium]|nr:hypothetical protein [Deltaproteobacteria bacterium]
MWRLFFIISLFLFCHPFLMADDKTVGTHSLADVFCTVVVEKTQKPDPYKDLDMIWGDLEKHLQMGILFSSISTAEQVEREFEKVRTTPAFKNCLDQNKKDFDLGEFILFGRKVAREALKAYQMNQKPELISISFPLVENIDGLNDISVELGIPTTQNHSVEVIEAVIHRERKYTDLWNEFIKGLKSKI